MYDYRIGGVNRKNFLGGGVMSFFGSLNNFDAYNMSIILYQKWRYSEQKKQSFSFRSGGGGQKPLYKMLIYLKAEQTNELYRIR